MGDLNSGFLNTRRGAQLKYIQTKYKGFEVGVVIERMDTDKTLGGYCVGMNHVEEQGGGGGECCMGRGNLWW